MDWLLGVFGVMFVGVGVVYCVVVVVFVYFFFEFWCQCVFDCVEYLVFGYGVDLVWSDGY